MVPRQWTLFEDICWVQYVAFEDIEDDHGQSLGFHRFHARDALQPAVLEIVDAWTRAILRIFPHSDQGKGTVLS